MNRGCTRSYIIPRSAPPQSPDCRSGFSRDTRDTREQCCVLNFSNPCRNNPVTVVSRIPARHALETLDFFAPAYTFKDTRHMKTSKFVVGAAAKNNNNAAARGCLIMRTVTVFPGPAVGRYARPVRARVAFPGHRRISSPSPLSWIPFTGLTMTGLVSGAHRRAPPAATWKGCLNPPSKWACLATYDRRWPDAWWTAPRTICSQSRQAILDARGVIDGR